MAYPGSKIERVVNPKPPKVRIYTKDSNELKDYRRKWRRENPEKMNAARRKWLVKNRHVAHAHTHINTLRCRYPEVADNISGKDLSAWILENRGRPCIYCGDKSTHIDHKTPLSKGGEHDFHNIQLICATCNRGKNDQTDQEFRDWITRLKAQEDVS